MRRRTTVFVLGKEEKGMEVFFWEGGVLAWGKEINSLGDGIGEGEGNELWEKRRGQRRAHP